MILNPGTVKDKGQGNFLWFFFYLMSLASQELVLKGRFGFR